MKLRWKHSPETEDLMEGWDATLPGVVGRYATIVVEGPTTFRLFSKGFELGTFGTLEKAKEIAEFGFSEQDMKDREAIITALRCGPLAAVWNAVVVLCDTDTSENYNTLRTAFTAASTLMKKIGDPT